MNKTNLILLVITLIITNIKTYSQENKIALGINVSPIIANSYEFIGEY